jgi:hypothetical protein
MKVKINDLIYPLIYKMILIYPLIYKMGRQNG